MIAAYSHQILSESNKESWRSCLVRFLAVCIALRSFQRNWSESCNLQTFADECRSISIVFSNVLTLSSHRFAVHRQSFRRYSILSTVMGLI